MSDLKTSMYFQEGSSDKVYHVYLTASVKGGQRGSTMNRADKGTYSDFTKAEREYSKIIREKVAKGYKVDSTSTISASAMSNAGIPPMSGPGTKSNSGIILQLSNQIEKEQFEDLMVDDDWVMQEKFDGHRRAIKKDNTDVLGINRKGEYVPIPHQISRQISGMSQNSFIADGELMGEKIVLFDLLSLNGTARILSSYADRLQSLNKIMEAMANVEVISTAFTAEEKRNLYTRIMARNGEGVVFKRLSSKYNGGRPNSGGDHLKFKFYETASFIVIRSNKKRSVGMGLFDSVEGTLVDVGNVTIPPNFDIPEVDQIIEVRYLYAYEGGSIYQPTYLGVRTDIDRFECTLDQIKFKPEPV
jgi:bifunctional non-homologous end joining protein LigD